MKPLTLRSRPLLSMRKSFLAIILITALSILSACGGGSGSGSPTDPPPAALTITTSSLPTGQTGVAYGAVLAAAGGTPPYNLTLTNGVLPPDLMLNAATGAITGTPTQAATNAALTFQVADSSTPPGSRSAKMMLTISTTSAGISISPKRGGLAVAQTLMVSATVANDTSKKARFVVSNRGQLFIE